MQKLQIVKTNRETMQEMIVKDTTIITEGCLYDEPQ
jgi:hypothetical protein